jgi:hypothetical protein
MKEKNVQVIFGKNNTIHGVFELKICNGTCQLFKSVREHQVEALLKASGEGLHYKIADMPQSFYGGNKNFRFVAKKPFDCIFLKNTPAFVVLCWYTPRKKKEFHYIEIGDWETEKMIATRKSITKERSYEIATYKENW